MNSRAHFDVPVPLDTTEAESPEDWSDIWALEDPAISGAVPVDQAPVSPFDPGDHAYTKVH